MQEIQISNINSELSSLDQEKLKLQIRAKLFKEGNFDFIVKRNGKEHSKQREALQILTSGKYTEFLFGGAAGGAKQQPLDSKVLTPNGFVKIRNLSIGCEIINPNGKTQKVTHLHPIQKNKQYVFKLSNGEEVISHEGHLWYGGWRRDKSDYLASWDNPYCIKTSKEIYEHTKKQLSKKKKRIFRIPISQDVEFNQKGDISIDPYLMGAMLGNGSITSMSELKITIFKDDLDDYVNLFKKLDIDHRVHIQTSKSCYDILFKAKDRDKYIMLFHKYDLLDRKSKTKFIPEEYKITSRENRLQIIRGLLDTDGHIEKNSGKTVFYTSSKRLADDFTWICRSLGFFATTNKRQRDDVFYEKENRTIKSSMSYYCYVRSKDNTNLFNIKRKKIKPKKENKDYMSVGVVDVEIREEVEMRCITVSEPNGLYITDNFTATHNSWTGCAWLLFMCINYPGTRWFIARNRLSDILESVLVTFKKVCEAYGFDRYKFNGQKYFLEFDNGSYINLVEISYKPSDPEFDAVGSTEYTGGWIEEVGQTHPKGADALFSRAGRYKNEEYGIKKMLFYTCNPKKNWAKYQFYDKSKNGTLEKEKFFMQCLVSENPFIEKEYVESLKAMKDRNPSMYKRLYLGDWNYEDNPYQLIEDEMIDSCFSNDQVKGGKRYITADVARFGSDKARIGYWEGWDLKRVISLDISKTTDVELAIRTLRMKYRIPRTRTVVDSDGVGGGVADGAGAQNFKNNGRPITKGSKTENYKNLQVQCLYYLADIVNDAKLNISADLTEKEREEIKEELSQIQSKGEQDPERKLDCKSKGDIKSDIGRSPDWRDMMMMRSYFDLKGSKPKFMGSKPRNTV